MDYYMNTIHDMQNEKDFFYHYKVFVYLLGFETSFRKSDDALLVIEVLGSNVCLYETDYYKNLLFF